MFVFCNPPVVAAILVVTMTMMSCSSGKQQAPRVRPEDKYLAAFQVAFERFLDIWLIKKDLREAQLFFSPTALSNPLLLSVPSAGYLDPDDRADPLRVRDGIAAFLLDFSSGLSAEDIRQVLVTAPEWVDWRAVLGVPPVNRVEHDKYYVFPFEMRFLAKLGYPEPGEQAQEFFKKETISGHLFLTLTFLREDGLLYWVWKHEGGSWKILHVDIAEM